MDGWMRKWCIEDKRKNRQDGTDAKEEGWKDGRRQWAGKEKKVLMDDRERGVDGVMMEKQGKEEKIQEGKRRRKLMKE